MPEDGRDSAPVKHSVKGRHFVHSHGRHFQELRHVVHNTNARPSLVLPLAQVEERNDGGFLVLWGVSRDNFFRPFGVLRVKGECNLEEMRVCHFEWNGRHTLELL